MRNAMLECLGAMAVLALVGCGGMEDANEAALSEQEQPLPMCKVDVPQPCPVNYYCDGRVCRPNPID
ncbi:hypothetical protein LZ198_00660 [Myxococcus sp. K15C18031901]|uniref:hypothetical protein n=1 Tax=Myxococcus dinghuensis TaxID=2906761 RepID=UPI0020A7DA1B|nr:hypothetical protein [Myxococcus dinghuensis]MCP3097376.1 hypothetical protein [Myxococcus dinghuensis]